MPCATAVFLKDRCCMWCDLSNVFFYAFTTGADNNAEISTLESTYCMENMAKKCATRNFMEDLGC
jgi:hypothetical protein